MPVARRHEQDESGEQSLAALDLETRVCSACGLELPPWQATCPTDGGDAIRRVDVPARADALLARFLDNDDEPVAGRDDDPTVS